MVGSLLCRGNVFMAACLPVFQLREAKLGVREKSSEETAGDLNEDQDSSNGEEFDEDSLTVKTNYEDDASLVTGSEV